MKMSHHKYCSSTVIQKLGFTSLFILYTITICFYRFSKESVNQFSLGRKILSLALE